MKQGASRLLIQITDHPEIVQAERPLRRGEEIAGVRIGMEKPGGQKLLEESIDPDRGEPFSIDSQCLHSRQVVGLDPMREGHREDPLRRPLPVDPGNVDVRFSLKIARKRSA